MLIRSQDHNAIKCFVGSFRIYRQHPTATLHKLRHLAKSGQRSHVTGILLTDWLRPTLTRHRNDDVTINATVTVGVTHDVISIVTCHYRELVAVLLSWLYRPEKGKRRGKEVILRSLMAKTQRGLQAWTAQKASQSGQVKTSAPLGT